MKDENKTKVIDELQQMARLELERANGIFPPFHSKHEAWAIMLEELKEAMVEFKDLKRGITKDLWDQVRRDKEINLFLLDCIEYAALNAICELLQVVAMKYKFETMLKETQNDV